MLVPINYFAVIVAAMVAVVIGLIWYNPAVFGKKWASLLGRDTMDLGNPKVGYALTVLGAVVMSAALAEVLKFAGATTVPGGWKIAGLVWLGFAASTGLVNAVVVGKKSELYLLEQAHHLVTLLVAAMVLVLMG